VLNITQKCGGAQSRARPSARRRRQQPVAGPSLLTGAQTAKRRKVGSRITAAGTFLGSGQALNADEDEKTTGTGFRKKAVRCVSLALSLISHGTYPWFSKRAREERAMAAQKRQLALEGKILFDSTETPSSPVEQPPQAFQADRKRMTPISRHKNCVRRTWNVVRQ
jgi:hypothetical protein